MMQQIDPQRLFSLRKARKLSRARLAKLSKVSERTIQRLEDPGRGGRTPRTFTSVRLAKALGVKPDVLSGEAPTPGQEPAKRSVEDSERVHIGALVAPKARLAYDLTKHRYGVSASELINMAPLFFTLLAEGSLAWRRQQLTVAHEAVERLDKVWEKTKNRMFVHTTIVGEEALDLEAKSIEKSDVFGDVLLDPDTHVNFTSHVFDPSTDNPFASYVRWLVADLNRAGAVEVERDNLSYGSPDKFPDYDICSDELDRVTNGSSDARRTLEWGHARLSEIPQELMADEANEQRAAWLEERLPDVYRNLSEREAMANFAKHMATMTPTEEEDMKSLLGEFRELDFGSTDEGGNP